MKVKFVPQNVEYEIKPGQSVMHLAQDHGIYIKSVCKGVPSCAECRVRVVEGDHNVLPPGSEELSLIGTGHFIDQRRLSCQLKCFGDITVDMTEQLAKEQGILVGRKKKQAVKNDRVEEAVARPRSEEPGEGDEATADAAPREGGVPPSSGGAARGSGEARSRDRGPRDGRGGGGGGSRDSRGPREGGRGGQSGPRDGQRDGRPRDGGGRPQGPRPTNPNTQAGSSAPQGQPRAEGPPGEGGPRKRRRRRGKGGGGGGQAGGPSGVGPTGGSGGGPSRPSGGQ